MRSTTHHPTQKLWVDINKTHHPTQKLRIAFFELDWDDLDWIIGFIGLMNTPTQNISIFINSHLHPAPHNPEIMLTQPNFHWATCLLPPQVPFSLETLTIPFNYHHSNPMWSHTNQFPSPLKEPSRSPILPSTQPHYKSPYYIPINDYWRNHNHPELNPEHTICTNPTTLHSAPSASYADH